MSWVHGDAPSFSFICFSISMLLGKNCPTIKLRVFFKNIYQNCLCNVAQNLISPRRILPKYICYLSQNNVESLSWIEQLPFENPFQIFCRLLYLFVRLYIRFFFFSLVLRSLWKKTKFKRTEGKNAKAYHNEIQRKRNKRTTFFLLLNIK